MCCLDTIKYNKCMLFLCSSILTMKITIYLSLVYLATVFCHNTADSDNQRRDENLISSSEHSRNDHHEYDAFEREARRKYETRKTTQAYKRIPAVRRIVPGEDEQYYEHKNNESEKRLHRGDDDSTRTNLSVNDSDHVDYQLEEEYPSLPLRPSSPSAPPVVFFGPQVSSGRRGIPLPVYRRPSYTRAYDIAPVPVAYRAINPVAYSVPVSRFRNVVLGYPSLTGPSVRYAYSPSNTAFENGGAPVEYRGFIAEEYDDFLKKK